MKCVCVCARAHACAGFCVAAYKNISIVLLLYIQEDIYIGSNIFRYVILHVL